MNLNIVKDLLREIVREQKEQREILNRLVEQLNPNKPAATEEQPKLTEMQLRMQRVREARGKNTGRA